MNILVNDEHELRSGWKFALYWILFVALYIAASLCLPLPAGPQTQLDRLILNTLPIVPAAIALLLMARFVDKVPAAVYGATLHEHWFRDLLVGLGVAVGMLADSHLDSRRLRWNCDDLDRIRHVA